MLQSFQELDDSSSESTEPQLEEPSFLRVWTKATLMFSDLMTDKESVFFQGQIHLFLAYYLVLKRNAAICPGLPLE